MNFKLPAGFGSETLRQRAIEESRATFKMGGPIIAAQMLQMSMGFVDTLMAGRLSANDLAAVAIGSSMLAPLFLFCFGVLGALNPLISQSFGARNFPLIGKNTRQAIWLGLIMSVFSIVLMHLMDTPLSWIGLEPEVAMKAYHYILASTWGVPFAFIYMAIRVFNDSIGATRVGMWIALGGLCTNIIGNYILVYGKLGFPQLGAVGTGFATSVVYFVLFTAIAVFTYRNKPYTRFEIFKNWRLPQWKYQKDLLWIGLPNGVSAFMEVSMFAVISLMIGSMGTQAVAGHQIAINFGTICFMIPFGLSTAISVRVGMHIGKQQTERALFIGWTGIASSVLVMICIAVFMLIFRNYIAAAYTSDADVAALGASLLVMAGIFQISDGLQVSGLGALRGLKDTRVPMLVNLVAYWVIGLPTGYWFGMVQEWGPKGFWIGLICGLTAAAVLHNLRFWMLGKRLMREAGASYPPVNPML